MNLRQATPSIITILAMACGFISILVVCESLQAESPFHLHVIAAQLIMLAAMLDGLDGNLARALNVESEIGAALDSHADLISFGVAPAVLTYGVMLNAPGPGAIWWIIPVAMVMSGMLRLARFSVTDPNESSKGFTGLPIPVCACWVSVVVFISQGGLNHSMLFDLSQLTSTRIFAAGILLMIILQISNVRYPKPSKNMLIFIPCVFLVLVFVVAGRGPIGNIIDSSWAVRSAIVMLFLGSTYILIGPAVVAGRERRLARREAGGREIPDDDDEF